MAAVGRTVVDVHLHLSRFWPEPETNVYGPGARLTLPGLLAEMDAAGVAEGVLVQINEAPNVEETLREGAELLQGSGGRLRRTSTVDPTRGEAEVRRAIALWEATSDLVAVKLFPGYQSFYPHDRRLDPLYEWAARRGTVVMIHQGDTLDRRALVKFARPIEVDEVAVRFPELPIVLCHMGNPWFEETVEMLYKNPRVYADTSGLLPPRSTPRFDGTFRHVVRKLQETIDGVGSAEKLLYGSDWPLVALEDALGLVRALDLSETERAGVLGGTARRLYRLDAAGGARAP